MLEINIGFENLIPSERYLASTPKRIIMRLLLKLLMGRNSFLFALRNGKDWQERME